MINLLFDQSEGNLFISGLGFVFSLFWLVGALDIWERTGAGFAFDDGLPSIAVFLRWLMCVALMLVAPLSFMFHFGIALVASVMLVAFLVAAFAVYIAVELFVLTWELALALLTAGLTVMSLLTDTSKLLHREKSKRTGDFDQQD